MPLAYSLPTLPAQRCALGPSTSATGGGARSVPLTHPTLRPAPPPDLYSPAPDQPPASRPMHLAHLQSLHVRAEMPCAGVDVAMEGGVAGHHRGCSHQHWRPRPSLVRLEVYRGKQTDGGFPLLHYQHAIAGPPPLPIPCREGLRGRLRAERRCGRRSASWHVLRRREHLASSQIHDAVGDRRMQRWLRCGRPGYTRG
ncbi:hypothetical protein E2562_019241 [Oryza meyeriana var. granulata]|uniref:Uncharacterized protein n=1 Tax=Oryza meyeriana var. granulata TaxID=110450 RepID=A0A6G1FA25_9ORYZ|nr:hypothetical protein E2562_019241 [Oryza meyeriana var. granulata]